MIHDLKCAPGYFQHLKSGRKRFELRKNDRGYITSDRLRLHEWTPDGYTGQVITATIGYIFYGGKMGLAEDYAILSLVNIQDCGIAGKTHDGKCCGWQKLIDDDPYKTCIDCPDNQSAE
jgi:hypothetical protein